MNYIIAAVIGAVLVILFLRTSARHFFPVRTAVFNMAAGVAALEICAVFLPVSVNVFTVKAALTLGLPGVALVVLAGYLL